MLANGQKKTMEPVWWRKPWSDQGIARLGCAGFGRCSMGGNRWSVQLGRHTFCIWATGMLLLRAPCARSGRDEGEGVVLLRIPAEAAHH